MQLDFSAHLKTPLKPHILPYSISSNMSSLQILFVISLNFCTFFSFNAIRLLNPLGNSYEALHFYMLNFFKHIKFLNPSCNFFKFLYFKKFNSSNVIRFFSSFKNSFKASHFYILNFLNISSFKIFFRTFEFSTLEKIQIF